MSDNSVCLRNTDEFKWDKPIIEAANPDEYYRRLIDKRLFEYASVILVEEQECYVLIKNIWKYDNNHKKCRNFTGDLFEVEDIEYIKIKETDYLKFDNLKDELPQNIIIRMA